MKKYSKQKLRELKAKKAALNKAAIDTDLDKLVQDNAEGGIEQNKSEESSDEKNDEAEKTTVGNLTGSARSTRARLKQAMRKAPAPENKLLSTDVTENKEVDTDDNGTP